MNWKTRLTAWLANAGTNIPSWWVILKGMIFQTGGEGPSVTKGAYGFVCLVTGLSLLVMVVAMCRVYVKTPNHDVNATFAGVVTLVFGLFMGFATSAHKQKNTQQVTAQGEKDAQSDQTV